MGIVGCVGTAVSILGLMAIWFRVRYLLLPLLLFLMIIIFFDAISIFAYITSGPPENLGESHYWYKRYMIVPDLSRNVFFFVIVKCVYSLVLVQAVIRAYKRNLKIRGGKSPFRVRSKSPRNEDVENPSGSPSCS